LVPVAKNRSIPLCRNPLIATPMSVTYMVTDGNLPDDMPSGHRAGWRSSGLRIGEEVTILLAA
jgi:hypothetical protein